MTGSTTVLTFGAEHSVSVPTSVVWHAVSEEELAMLIEGGKDRSFEWGLAFLGAFLGSFPTLVKVIVDFNRGVLPAGFDTFQAAIALILAAAAAVLIKQHLSGQQKMSQIEARIRARRVAEPAAQR